MHGVAMVEWLWELIRAEQDQVGLVVSGMTLSLLTTSLRVIVLSGS